MCSMQLTTTELKLNLRVPSFNMTRLCMLTVYSFGVLYTLLLFSERMSHKFFMKNPCNTVARIPNPRFTVSNLRKTISLVFDHFIPAYVMDAYLRLLGRRPMWVKFSFLSQPWVKEQNQTKYSCWCSSSFLSLSFPPFCFLFFDHLKIIYAL